VKQSHISRFETDDSKDVKGSTLTRLARALGVSTDYLLGLTDETADADDARLVAVP